MGQGAGRPSRGIQAVKVPDASSSHPDPHPHPHPQQQCDRHHHCHTHPPYRKSPLDKENRTKSKHGTPSPSPVIHPQSAVHLKCVVRFKGGKAGSRFETSRFEHSVKGFCHCHGRKTVHWSAGQRATPAPLSPSPAHWWHSTSHHGAPITAPPPDQATYNPSPNPHLLTRSPPP